MDKFNTLNALQLSTISNEFLVDFISNSISLDTAVVTPEDVQSIIDGNVEGLNPRVVSLVNNYLDSFLSSTISIILPVLPSHILKLIAPSADLTDLNSSNDNTSGK